MNAQQTLARNITGTIKQHDGMTAQSIAEKFKHEPSLTEVWYQLTQTSCVLFIGGNWYVDDKITDIIIADVRYWS